MARSTDRLLRVMLDANVLVAGLVWPRWPYELLRHAEKRQYQLVLSARIIEETQKNPVLLTSGRLATLDDLLAISECELVDDPDPEEIALNGDLMRDFTDIPIALAAINAQVDCFITHDRDFTERTPDNEELHQRLHILLPAVFLRDYMGWRSEALEAIRARTWDQV